MSRGRVFKPPSPDADMQSGTDNVAAKVARSRHNKGDDGLQQYLEWIKEFLARRGMERADGRMLFSYRASKDEYLSLRALFAADLRAHAGDPWRLPRASACACFVLYASEWWRREYAGGLWRWTNILESFGEPFNLDVLERTVAVERGLRAWGHRPGGEGKKYLGAIVAQGGLPLQLVATGDGSITRLLVRGMRQAQTYGWDATRLEGFFAAHADELVQHLRDEDIYALLASVVTTVLALRHEHGLAGASDPVGLLDRQEGNWRDRFPIAVDDRAAEPLLAGLVREAAREVKAVTSFPVIVTRSLELQPDGGTYALVMNIHMPSSLPTEALAQATGLPRERLPHLFSIDLLGQQRLPLGIGRQLLGSQETQVVLSGRPRTLRGQDALQEQVVVLRAAGEDIHEPVEVPGAFELDPEQPWIFVARDGATPLIGVGACRVPEGECFVAIGDGWELVPLEPDSALALHGITSGLTSDRLIYRVTGSVEARGPDARFVIKTRQSAHLDSPLVWRGSRLYVGSRSIPLYRGVPQLCRVEADGHIIALPPSSIEWTVSGRGAEALSQLRHHAGPVDAWVLQDGRRHRRFRMVLLPADARIRFASGNSASEAAIEFIGWKLGGADVPVHFDPQEERDAGTIRVHMSVSGSPPDAVPFSLRWANSPIDVGLNLPFPVSGGRFTRTDGSVLAEAQAVSIRDLQNTRVQVFDRNPESPRRYTLSVELKSGSAARGPSSVNALQFEQLIPVGKAGFGELRLLEIESALLGLMSQDDQLDTRLELVLRAGPTPIGKLLVKRYDAELRRDGLELELPSSVFRSCDISEVAQLQLRALPLLIPAVREVELTQETSEGIPTGRWRPGVLPAEKGPWLIYSASGSSLQLRPMLYTGVSIGQIPPDLSELCELGAAMAESEPHRRMVEIDKVLGAMAQDLEHRSWELLTRQYAALSHLPLAAFDYWRALAKDPAASLAVVLKLSREAITLTKRMRDELGVSWELVPRSVVSACLAGLERSWAKQLRQDASEATVRMITEQVFRGVAQAEPSLGTPIELALFNAGYCRTAAFDRLISELAVGAQPLLHNLWAGEDSLLQRLLLRAHTQDAVWPFSGLTRKLLGALQQCAPEAAHLLAQACGKQLLWMPTAGESGSHAKNVKEDAANVPLLAALLSHLPGCPQTWRTAEVLARIRQLRAFDAVWFEVAHRTGLMLALMLEQKQLVPRRSPGASAHKTPSHPSMQ